MRKSEPSYEYQASFIFQMRGDATAKALGPNTLVLDVTKEPREVPLDPTRF